MTTMSTIRDRHADIMAAWMEEAGKAASARGLTTPELANIMPGYLTALADVLSDGVSDTAIATKHIESHLATRLRQGFDLAEIVAEFLALGRCINHIVALEAEQGEKLSREIERATVSVTDMFTRHMLEDEQSEKRFLRRIQQMAADALHDDGVGFRDRLRDVLDVVREALHCDAAALLLFEADSGALKTSASVGVGDLDVGDGIAWADDLSFAGLVGLRDELTELFDVNTSDFAVGRTMRESSVQSLLGVALPHGRRLRGVLYVGLVEHRRFTTREARRLEALSVWIGLHLDNATLFSDLQEKIDVLEEERELRERFVSVLAHDLRGPLSAAKMSAAMIAKQTSRAAELSARVDHSLNRLDAMVTDLLDANRIYAGERLAITVAPCDAGAIAAEVIEEIAATHGERFHLDVDDGVTGVWSAAQLRRALWNLLLNAVKYGDPVEPITVAVKRWTGTASLSVHNEGPPIPAVDLPNIFRPFARGRAARVGDQRGWGLGLALVRGCAEAHGGRVEVQSDAGGTTFTMTLPLDARAFQEEHQPSAPP